MKEYRCATIEDITSVVNAKNIDSFLNDFEVYLRSIVYFKSAEIPIEFKSFTWIDDNKKEIKFQIDLE